MSHGLGAPRTSMKWTSTSSRKWGTSKTRTSPSLSVFSPMMRRPNEDPQGTVVRPELHRHCGGDDRLPDPLARHHDRPPGAADAGLDRGGDNAGLSYCVHADGHGGDRKSTRLNSSHSCASSMPSSA